MSEEIIGVAHIDHRAHKIGARYINNKTGKLVILDAVDYIINTDSIRAKFHDDNTQLSYSYTETISSFLDAYTLATTTDIPLASEPEPEVSEWYEEVKEHARLINLLAQSAIGPMEVLPQDLTVIHQILSLAEITSDLCDRIAVLKA